MGKQKDAYWFKHDSNAHNDQKILRLRVKYGYEGYGIYWAIVEFMRDQSDHSLDSGCVDLLSIAIGVEQKKLEQIIKDCTENFGLFIEKKGKYYSNRLLRDMKHKIEVSNKMRTNVLQRYNKSNAKEPTIDIALEKKRKEKKREDILFKDSSFFDIDVFKKGMGEKYQKYDLNYYYEAVLNWSDSKNVKRKDWIGTARNFILKDLKTNTEKLKPLSYKSQFNRGNNDPSTAHL